MTIKFSLSEIRFISIVTRLLSRAPYKSMSEAEIIDLANRKGWLTQNEQLNVPSRVDSRFANKIHNVVSHRDSRKNPIRLGLFGWDQDSSSFLLTEKGMEFLRSVAQKLGAENVDDFTRIDRWLSTTSR